MLVFIIDRWKLVGKLKLYQRRPQTEPGTAKHRGAPSGHRPGTGWAQPGTGGCHTLKTIESRSPILHFWAPRAPAGARFRNPVHHFPILRLGQNPYRLAACLGKKTGYGICETPAASARRSTTSPDPVFYNANATSRTSSTSLKRQLFKRPLFANHPVQL